MKTITSIIAIILVGGGLYYGYTIILEQELAKEKAEAQARAEQTAKEQRDAEEAKIAARTKCSDVGKYFVVSMDRDGSIGQDILVKLKEGESLPACKYEMAEKDFEIKNADPEYYKGLGENALITDIGTGPSGRSFKLYDLTDRKMITEKKYFDELTIDASSLKYWGFAKQKADAKNCSDFKKFTDEKLTPNLVVEKTIDLKTYLVKEGKTTKCVASQ